MTISLFLPFKDDVDDDDDDGTGVGGGFTLLCIMWW